MFTGDFFRIYIKIGKSLRGFLHHSRLDRSLTLIGRATCSEFSTRTHRSSKVVGSWVRARSSPGNVLWWIAFPLAVGGPLPSEM